MAELERPVPNMDELRRIKAHRGYGHIPINWSHYLYNEPLVCLDDYGLANHAYYSRPNGTIKRPIPGVLPQLYARRSIAETLKLIDQRLANPVIVDFFGGEVELFVGEAWRTITLQMYLDKEVFPRHMERWSGLTGLLMEERRRLLIGSPSTDPAAPSPHLAGAVDVTLRWKQPHTRRFVDDVRLELGYVDGVLSEELYPDYYEGIAVSNRRQAEARRNRRAFVAFMTGTAFGELTNMVVNPTEFFHWGRGDQLSALVAGRSSAYYSVAKPPGQ